MNGPVLSITGGNLLKILAPVKPSGMFVLKMLPEPGEAGLKPRRPLFSGVAAVHLRRTAPAA